MIVIPMPLGPLDTNCYLAAAAAPGPAALIDASDDAEFILRAAKEAGLAIERILLTHTHFDHILALAPLRRDTGAPIGVHAAEAHLLSSEKTKNTAASFGADYEPVTADFLIEDGQTIVAGALTFTALHTPGHSPGGLSFYTEDPASGERAAFTGDALFAGTIGRTDFEGGDMETLLRSIREKLFGLPDDAKVFPGHGWASEIGKEMRENPFFAKME